MESYDDLVYWLKTGKPFSFSRYGDGEWNAILGIGRGANVDGQTYTPSLTNALRASLTTSATDHFFALNPIARLCGQENIDQYLASNGLNIKWLNGDMMLEASINGRLYPLVAALRERPLIYVGSNALEDFIGREFPNSSYIAVPSKNSFDVWPQTAVTITSNASDGSVVAFSNGMATNILISHLRRSNRKLTLLDMGSVWEGYVTSGAKRSHVKKLSAQTIRRNLR